MYSVKELKEVLESSLEKGITKFIINVQESEYIDSSGFALLLSFNSKLMKKGMKLRIVFHPDKSMLFQHFGVSNMIHLFQVEEFAVESFY
jgi:anti-anti-sigma factor